MWCVYVCRESQLNEALSEHQNALSVSTWREVDTAQDRLNTETSRVVSGVCVVLLRAYVLTCQFAVLCCAVLCCAALLRA
jgi:hypothetical protein